MLNLEKTIVMPSSIRMMPTTINFLLKEVNQVNLTNYSSILFDFKETSFFSAEMTTFLAIIIRKLQHKKISVLVKSISDPIKKILAKNGFLNHFGIAPLEQDIYGTTIPFVEFKSSSTKQISKYLSQRVFKKMDEKITPTQNDTIKLAIFEICYNIYEHSQAEKFFMCGQVFPNKNHLAFSIADNGITIPTNIKDHLSLGFTNDAEYIDWATKEGNSTKNSSASGLGLFDIKDSMSKIGKFVILSNTGLNIYDLDNNRTYYKLEESFPGTMLYLNHDLNKQIRPKTVNEFIF